MQKEEKKKGVVSLYSPPPLALTPYKLKRRLFELQARVVDLGEENKPLALTTNPEPSVVQPVAQTLYRLR
jgi:hypothetical protein